MCKFLLDHGADADEIGPTWWDLEADPGRSWWYVDEPFVSILLSNLFTVILLTIER